jgi:hypothetical protein
MSAGLVQSVRFVSKAEYWFWMDSPFCRRIPEGESLQPQDLGTLFSRVGNATHSFVYLSDSLVFSKNSPDAQHTYQIQLFEDMFHHHWRKQARHCLLKGNSPEKSCPAKLVFHRCRSLPADFYTNDPEVQRLHRQILPLEAEVFAWVSGKGAKNIARMESVLKGLGILWQRVRLLKESEVHSQNRFKFRALELRLIGLLLSDSEIVREAAALRPLLERVYDYQMQLPGVDNVHPSF